MPRTPFLLAISAVAIILLASSEAAAQGCWTSTGSSTVVFTEDQPYSEQSLSNLQVGSFAPFPFTVDGILSISGIAPSSGNGKALFLRYRDEGADGQIIVRLRQVEIGTGAASALMVFDSDSGLFPQQSTFQTRGICINTGGGFDFTRYTYFLKVEITRRSTNANPSLQLVQVCPYNCV